ncbi:MAG: hypothetical protein LR015_12215 [Verrucomicrobia bacterium]|nr:hypothetical protein [Verrucomicrobiota bacterium]
MVYPEIQQFAVRLRRRASRCGLVGITDDAAQHTQLFRNFLNVGHTICRRYHRLGGAGLKVAAARATVMDVLLEFLFEKGLKRATEQAGGWQPEVALLALGGYGRCELCPFSDIDIMFLYQDRCKDPRLPGFQRALNDTVLYMLWDLNLKVGHSTRSIKEAIEEAKKDIHQKTVCWRLAFYADRPSWANVSKDNMMTLFAKTVHAFT